MTTFIKLTLPTVNRPAWVNADAIQQIQENQTGPGSCIWYPGDADDMPQTVQETPEEILAMLEAKA